MAPSTRGQGSHFDKTVDWGKSPLEGQDLTPLQLQRATAGLAHQIGKTRMTPDGRKDTDLQPRVKFEDRLHLPGDVS